SRMTPVCAPALLGNGARPGAPAELTRFNLLHTTPDRHDWSVWLRAFGIGSVDIAGGEVYPSGDLAYRAAVLGQGVVVGDLAVLQDEFRSGALVALFKDMELTVPSEAYHVFGTAERWDDPRVRQFRGWLREMFAVPAGPQRSPRPAAAPA
ncbi:MAG: LysR substrate-binding domain-containing protein, partial [Dongiaceae bacterium]